MARFVCIAEGYRARTYNEFWGGCEDVATEYAEHLDNDVDGEGPSERVIFVHDIDYAEIVAVAVKYAMRPEYFGQTIDEKPDDRTRAALAAASDEAADA